MRRLASVAAVVVILGALAGCAAQATDLLRRDLGAAQRNFERAGLEAEAACMQALLADLGQPDQIDFEVDGLVSGGSVPYIVYYRTAGSGRKPIPDTCYVIIGKTLTTLGKHGIRAFTP